MQDERLCSQKPAAFPLRPELRAVHDADWDYCGGCGNGNQSCAIARCSLAHDGVEYCFECRDFPCEKYRDAGQYDSFITHRRQMDDLALAARDGIEAYNAVQREKVELLHRLLSEYNDGRKKTLFSLAVNLMELPDLQRAMALIDTQDNAGTMPQKDRAKHNILPLSKFGLMQITRQRVRPAMDVTTDEECPVCFGKGKIKPSILFTDSLESKLDYLVNKLKVKKFTLHIHPYVAAYVNQGMVSLKRKWQMKYGFGIKVIPNQNLAMLEYKFYDSKGEEIDMKEEFEIK